MLHTKECDRDFEQTIMNAEMPVSQVQKDPT